MKLIINVVLPIIIGVIIVIGMILALPTAGEWQDRENYIERMGTKK